MLTGALLLSSAAVHAQGRPPSASSEPSEVATRLAERARAAFERREFSFAAQLFLDAFAQFPNPNWRYNAARAYQEAGQWAEAEVHYTACLGLSLEDPAETAVFHRESQLRIKQVREAKAKAEAAKPVAPTAPTTPTTPTAPTTPATPTAPATTPPATPTTPATPASPAAPAKPIAPAPIVVAPVVDDAAKARRNAWIVTGTGAGVALVGVILLAVGQGQAADLEDDLRGDLQLGGNWVRYPTLRQRDVADRASTADALSGWGGALFGAGVVTAAVGGYLLIRGSRSSAADRLSWGATPTGDGGVLWLSGSFGGRP